MASMPEGDIISRCFDSILSGLSNAARHIILKKKDQSIGSNAGKLRREIERLRLWGNGHSIQSRNLNLSLSCSADLRFAVLSRLYELGTVTKERLLPCVADKERTTIYSQEINNLEAGLKPLLEILQDNNRKFVNYEFPLEPKKDVLDMSVPLSEIHILTDCLMDLSLAIEDCWSEFNSPVSQKQSQKFRNEYIPQNDNQITPREPTLQKFDQRTFDNSASAGEWKQGSG
ncbi:hypothetical protein F4805DRAFT_478848 [Annulohypoxylon moriforme]|nr:hypothetical protein F4805DRAFT_478848 [Annulohypoxylon moriforme]